MGDFRPPQIEQDMCNVCLDTIKCYAEQGIRNLMRKTQFSDLEQNKSLFQRLTPEKQLSTMTGKDKVQCLFTSIKVQK